MWEKISTFEAEDAKMVVSLRGDILSPKYAPEMIEPAVHASGTSSASPIPRSAIPMVAMVVHELPDMIDTNAQMTQVLTRKKRGDMICTP